MSEHKNFCQTHHLYYTCYQCPLCEKERIDKMVQKFDTKEVIREEKVPREINEDDIQRLIEKFNVK